MKRHIGKLTDLAKKNVLHCPWCNSLNSKTYFTYLKAELKELESAFRKKDYNNVQEEIGDVIWDAVVLAHICEREGKFSAKSAVKNILEKIQRRKPYLVNGKKVSLKESQEIWKEAKLKEKELSRKKRLS